MHVPGICIQYHAKHRILTLWVSDKCPRWGLFQEGWVVVGWPARLRIVGALLIATMCLACQGVSCLVCTAMESLGIPPPGDSMPGILHREMIHMPSISKSLSAKHIQYACNVQYTCKYQTGHSMPGISNGILLLQWRIPHSAHMPGICICLACWLPRIDPRLGNDLHAWHMYMPSISNAHAISNTRANTKLVSMPGIPNAWHIAVAWRIPHSEHRCMPTGRCGLC